MSHYEVERSAGPGQTMVREVKGTIYVDPQGGSGNLAYRVWAVNDRSFPGHWSPVLETQAQAGRAGKPRSLSASADGQHAVMLSWSAPTDNGGATISGYRIDYSAEDNVVRMLASGHATTTYVDTGLDTGVNYCYRVAATNTNGMGPYSGQACATTEGLPDAPENLRLTHVGRDRMTLKWDPPSLGGEVEHYEYRYDYEEPVRVTGRTTQVSVRGLSEGFTYDFKVRAGNALGEGD